MNTINLIIKPTYACNFKCVYCYNHAIPEKKDNRIIDLNMIKKMIITLSELYSNIKCIWLGGEPLLFTLNNYQEICEFQNKIATDHKIKFKNNVQTNSFLLDDAYIDFFMKNNFGISVSYDGIHSAETRGHGQDLLDKILVLKNRNVINSVLYVISAKNYMSLLDDYKLLKKHGINCRINRYIPNTPKDELDLTNKQYVDIMFELFKIYYKDRQIYNNIIIEPFEEYIHMIKDNQAYSCEHGNCLYKFICLDSYGDIFTCARSSRKITNIANIKNCSDIFMSDIYKNMHNNAKAKREICKDCELFYYCVGGCQHRASINNDYCIEFKSLFTKIRDHITNDKKF